MSKITIRVEEKRSCGCSAYAEERLSVEEFKSADTNRLFNVTNKLLQDLAHIQKKFACPYHQKTISLESNQSRKDSPASHVCDDCGYRTSSWTVKSDHHGGVKRVCIDRNACHQREI